jgi:hypothetical protein
VGHLRKVPGSGGSQGLPCRPSQDAADSSSVPAINARRADRHRRRECEATPLSADNPRVFSRKEKCRTDSTQAVRNGGRSDRATLPASYSLRGLGSALQVDYRITHIRCRFVWVRPYRIRIRIRWIGITGRQWRKLRLRRPVSPSNVSALLGPFRDRAGGRTRPGPHWQSRVVEIA